VDDPLAWLIASRGREIEHNVLSHPAHFTDESPFERPGNFRSRRLQRLFLFANPHGLNAITLNAFVQAIGDGFDFR
jgi:hypothetical protein